MDTAPRLPAVLLRDGPAFATYLGQRGNRAADSAPFRLHEVRDGGEPWLLLVGDDPGDEAVVPGEVGTVTVDGPALTFRRGLFRRNRHLVIASTREAPTLLELVPLEASSAPPDLTHVLFATRDAAQAQDLVGACVSLGNDRIVFARAGRDGAEQVLLRVDKAPSYLVLRALEQPEGPAVYRRSSDRVWVAWGLRHPLERRWAAETTGGATYLLGQEGALRFDSLAWSPLQDGLDVQPDFPAAPVMVGLPSEGVRFRVPLRLEPTSEHRAPSLWLLEASQLPQLERLLGSLDGHLLAAFQLAVVDDPARGRRYILREAERREPTHLDPGGQAFSQHRLVRGLHLPAGHDLRPSLPAEVYARVLGLKPGHVALVEGAGPQARALAVPESAFKPVETLVDHLVEAGAQQLAAVRARSIFDLGPYADLPSRPPMPREQATPRGPPPGGSGPPSASQPSDHRLPETGPRPPRPPRPPGERQVAAEPVGTLPRRASSALLEEEERLESELATSGPTVDRWSSLMEVKRRLERWPDAVECGVELLWLDPSPEEEGRTRAQLVDSLECWTRAMAGLSGGGAEAARRATALLQAEQAARAEPASPRALANAARVLREVEPDLRFKTRWLAWERLLATTGDEREAARVRRGILEAMGRGNLGQAQLPPFVVRRLAGLKGASAADRQPATSQILLVQGWAERLPPGLQSAARATSARGLAAFGDAGQAEAFLQVALGGLEHATPAQQAWILVFAAATAMHVKPAEARAHRKALQLLTPRLRADEAALLAEVDRLLAERQRAEDPARLLSAESLSRLFPKGAGVQLPGRLSEPLDLFATAVREGRLGGTFGPVVQALQAEMRSSAPDVPALGRAAEALNDLLRLAGEADRPALLEGLEDVWKTVPHHPPRGAAGGHFEYALLRLQLATGRGSLGDDVMAAAGLAEVVEWFGALAPSRIDCEDVCGKALDTASTLPVTRRAPVLESAAQALTVCLLTQRPSSYDELHLLKCLDQAVETAGSRERLVVSRLRTWLEQDELQIRRRLARPLGGDMK